MACMLEQPQCARGPSYSSHDWLFCEDEMQMRKYPYNNDTEHFGKWLTFHRRTSIDESWGKAKEYYCAGLLDGVSSMKVSGVGTELERADCHVIIYYCDYNDAYLCKAIGERVVNIMKYHNWCHYKSDAMSPAGMYCSAGFKSASIMKVAPFQSSFEAPSSSSNRWLYWIDELQNMKYTNNHDTEHWGKWKTFHRRTSIDEAWGKAKEYYCAGLLDGVSSMKVSGVETENERADCHVIIYYCDYNDASLCKAVGERIVNMMKYYGTCYYKIDNMALAVVYGSAEKTPSSSSDHWLYCVDEFQMVKYPYNHDTEHWGKWMTLHGRASIDEAWEKAKEYYCAGLLDGVSNMKVCGTRTEPGHADGHVIIYYCAYNDASLCKAIGERIVNMMKCDRHCYYNTSAMTIANIDRSAGFKCAAVMTIAPFEASSSPNDLNCLLFCRDELQMTKYPYKHDTEHWGKWMTFHNRASIDETWGKAKEYYCAGLLDGVSCMKVSHGWTESEHTDSHVIIYYCAYNDASLCKDIGERVVRMMKYDRPCYYKTDAMTFASECESVMKIAPFEASFEAP